jgi:hypothetical protein
MITTISVTNRGETQIDYRDTGWHAVELWSDHDLDYFAKHMSLDRSDPEFLTKLRDQRILEHQNTPSWKNHNARRSG